MQINIGIGGEIMDRKKVIIIGGGNLLTKDEK